VLDPELPIDKVNPELFIVRLPLIVRLTQDAAAVTVTVAPAAIIALSLPPCVGTTPPTQVVGKFHCPPAAVDVMLVCA